MRFIKTKSGKNYQIDWANREHRLVLNEVEVKTLLTSIYGYFIKNPLDFEFNIVWVNKKGNIPVGRVPVYLPN